MKDLHFVPYWSFHTSTLYFHQYTCNTKIILQFVHKSCKQKLRNHTRVQDRREPRQVPRLLSQGGLRGKDLDLPGKISKFILPPATEPGLELHFLHIPYHLHLFRVAVPPGPLPHNRALRPYTLFTALHVFNLNSFLEPALIVNGIQSPITP